MKVSQIGLNSKKITQLDAQFPVQDMLVQTSQLDQFASGVYAYGHIPYLVKQNIHHIICEVLSKYNCALISLPIMQPESIWISSGRLDKYVSENVMFRCLNEKGNFCLAPTAEEAVVTFAKKRLFSHKQLPVTYFQIGEKFRNELRSRGFLLRGKAFDMMDAYSFGRNQHDLDVAYENMKQAYFEIFDKLHLPVQPVGADSGAIGGSKSEEFMMLSDIGEDNILVDVKTNQALNCELLEREDAEEYLLKTYNIQDIDKLEKKKAVELGHIFQLGDKYSKAMGATYLDANNQYQNFVMGCYGIGVSRTLAMVYEKSIIKKDGQFEGISLPLNLVPYGIYIIPKDNNQKEVMPYYEQLEEMQIPSLYDDREGISIGAKIKDCKVLGIPYFVVFGTTMNDNYVIIENTISGNKMNVSLDKFVEVVQKFEKERYHNISLEEILHD